jgi:8-oxo-dGTP pyrophosphatase MutT (NUDIX family)
MKSLKFEYKNLDGEIKIQEVAPLGIEFGVTPCMQKPEWLLRARDSEKNEERSFVLKNIQRMIDEKVQRFLCVTVYVRNDEGKFLMIQSRKLNRWIPPGGKVERHETPDEAAMRECLEETGIHIELVGERAPVEGGLMRPYGNQLNQIKAGIRDHVDLIYFAKPLAGEVFKRCERETSNIGWFDPQEIAHMNTFPSVVTWSNYFAAL